MPMPSARNRRWRARNTTRHECHGKSPVCARGPSKYRRIRCSHGCQQHTGHLPSAFHPIYPGILQQRATWIGTWKLMEMRDMFLDYSHRIHWPTGGIESSLVATRWLLTGLRGKFSIMWTQNPAFHETARYISRLLASDSLVRSRRWGQPEENNPSRGHKTQHIMRMLDIFLDYLHRIHWSAHGAGDDALA